MIVDRVVQVTVAAALLLVVSIADDPTELTVPSAVRDPPELLDIKVNEITWGAVLVANRPGRPNE